MSVRRKGEERVRERDRTDKRVMMSVRRKGEERVRERRGSLGERT